MPLNFPDKLALNASYEWESKLLPTYTGLSLVWVIVGGNQSIEIEGELIGDRYQTRIQPTLLSEFLPGSVYYQAWAVNGETGERFLLDQGSSEIIPDLGSVSLPFDGRSNAQKQLEEVENAIAAIMAGGQEYTIGDRTLKRADLGQLRIWRNQLAVQVQREKNKDLGLRGVQVRFIR